MKTYIKGISYYLPEIILSNEDLLKEFPEWSVDKVATKIGVYERHICSQNETSTDMAIKAAQRLFEEYKIEPNLIDFTILCTQSPDYFLPTSACIIQDKLGIPTKSGAFDINLGCSGFVYGLAIAKGLINASLAKNVLLITSETYSKFLHPNDKSNRTIFGDAAAATLISNEGFAELNNFCFGTDGSGAEKLIVRTGGFRDRENKQDLVYDENNNPNSSDHLFMDGSGIFNFTLEMVPILVNDTLMINNLTQSDIDLFLFHQANEYMLNFLRKKIRIPEDKFYINIRKTGNTVSSTIPIGLKEALISGSIQQNHKILIAGFGVGFSWAGCILNF